MQDLKKFNVVFYYSDEEKAICDIEAPSKEAITNIITGSVGNFLEIPTSGAEIMGMVNLSLVRRIKIYEE